MQPQLFIPFAIAIVVLPIYSSAAATPSQDCPLIQSIYRDVSGKGFELVFGPPLTKKIYPASAVIQHVQAGKLYEFDVSQSSGYGSVWLGTLKQLSSGRLKSFWITFFDQDLQEATPLWFREAKKAPQYAVIAELGSYDYYQRHGTKNPPLIGDVMWKFDRCQPKQ